jgi:hypothetical protein
MQNAAWDLVQHEVLLSHIDRVSRVRAALVPNDPGGALSEDIDELALAFVAPLSADNDDSSPRVTEQFQQRTG